MKLLPEIRKLNGTVRSAGEKIADVTAGIRQAVGSAARKRARRHGGKKQERISTAEKREVKITAGAREAKITAGAREAKITAGAREAKITAGAHEAKTAVGKPESIAGTGKAVIEYGTERHLSLPAEILGLRKITARIDELLTGDSYISRSDIARIRSESDEIRTFFHVLRKSGMLDVYCGKHGIEPGEIVSAAENLQNLEAISDAANETWIRTQLTEKKEMLDHILDPVDPSIRLDEDQRRVVLTDEDRMLVIAGAGAGKTTTIAAKVRYLVEHRNIDPADILIVSFTNKAVQELKDRICRDLKIVCPVTTFHSAGNAILRIHSDEKKRIVEGGTMYVVLRDYFRTKVLEDETLAGQMLLFFASYFEAPVTGGDLNDFLRRMSRMRLSTIRSDLNEYNREIIDARSHKRITVRNEWVRSVQEVEIANFLYLNGIDYEYEPLYPYNITGALKPYTPDFVIRQGEHTAYLEHFGISQDGKNSRYSEEELEKYRRAVNDKIVLHRNHGTELIYTFSSYRDGRALEKHLAEELEAHGFTLNPRPAGEVLEKLVTQEENKYIRRFVFLICRFISNFKVNGYTEGEFDRMARATDNVRSRLFLEICHNCYLEYEKFLNETHSIDFEDMINESARILREAEEMKTRLHFKYVIVDEYQDISRQRFDLTRELAKVTDAKIIAVGDDWQSIYAFSGSDISLFTHFEETVGCAKMLRIENTYRNAQEVIDIAGDFIQKNPEQIRKTLRSPKTIKDPVIIYTYDGRRRQRGDAEGSGAAYASAAAVEKALKHIRESAGAKMKNAGAEADEDAGSRDGVENEPHDYGTVLLLGRYGFDGDLLERSGRFDYDQRRGKLTCFKYPDMDITFMTAHSSKGLGYDNVIVINARNETYGFPSKIQDDPVLSFVIRGDRSIDHAEERRLFYVAMTRTRNRVYFAAPEQNPSEFLLELKKNYGNIRLEGEWNEEVPEDPFRKVCPVCGYPMQLRYKKAYGLRLYLCTNDPEICDFMTNEIRAGKLSIRKCDCCRDGYLIIKPGRNDTFFLGCTNYRRDGRGCNRTMN